MSMNAADPRPLQSQFTLGVAIALFLSGFGVFLPLLTYFSRNLHLAHQAEGPKLLGLIAVLSPWLPCLIAVAGAAALLVKESRVGPAAAQRWNLAAIAAAVLVGGGLILVVALPMAQLLFALNGR